jgi:Na+-translocating ferredoxin:NAD+ oxidoreductase RnfD subunit
MLCLVHKNQDRLSVFLSLVVGLLLLPIDRITTWLATRFAELVFRLLWKLQLSRRRTLFSAARFAESDAAPFVAWLMTKPAAKAHWEWEYFLHQLCWGLFTNVLTFVALTSYLLWERVPQWQLPMGSLLALLVVGSYGALRSIAMNETHDHHLKRFRQETRPRESAF